MIVFRATLIAAALALASRPTRAQVADSSATGALMPVPDAIRWQPGALAIDSSFAFAATRFVDARLRAGIARSRVRLERRTGLPLPPALARSPHAAVVVEVAGAGQRVPSLSEDESYTLDVGPGGAVLRAATVVGALRGLETLLQLVDGRGAGFVLPFVHVSDRPRFPWRGLLVDVARHFQSVAEIERTLDAMAMVKLNVLHWHLSDDQGFRVESRVFPRLQRMGSDGQFYTQAQIREVVSYARERGIRVVPEFDMPGHSASWFVGYPRLAAGTGPFAIGRDFGVFDPVFDPTRETVYRFLDRFIGEMAPLFPDAYWHVGGDEVNGKAWSASPRIRAFMRRHHLADNQALQTYFNTRLSRILARHHKRMVGWDEILRPGLPRTTVVQSWRGSESLLASARDGYAGILSAPYYLDAMRSAADYYAADPMPGDTAVDPAVAARILGGEVCMWGELLSPENIDSRIWPRTAAVAERFWSPRSVRDPDDMYRRLAVMSARLEDAGLEHLAGPARMLRRVAGSADDGVLRELSRLVEPVRLGSRMHERPPSTLTPLVGLGDIVAPDAPGRRSVRREVLALLSDAPSFQTGREALARQFADWRALPARIDSLAASAPLVRDADSASVDLAALGVAGQQALDYLASGQPAPATWTTETLALLERADRPKALLHVAVVPAVRTLVVAAGQGGLGTR